MVLAVHVKGVAYKWNCQNNAMRRTAAKKSLRLMAVFYRGYHVTRALDRTDAVRLIISTETKGQNPGNRVTQRYLSRHCGIEGLPKDT